MRLKLVVIAVLLASVVAAAHEPRKPKPEPKVETTADELDQLSSPGWRPQSGVTVANLKDVDEPPKHDRHREHTSSWRYANEVTPEPPKLRKPRAEPRRVSANLYIREPMIDREPDRVTVAPHIITRTPVVDLEPKHDIVRAHIVTPEPFIPIKRDLIQAHIVTPEPEIIHKREYVLAHAIVEEPSKPISRKRSFVTAINVTPREESPAPLRTREFVRANAIFSDEPLKPKIRRHLRVLANAHISRDEISSKRSVRRHRIVANAHITRDVSTPNKPKRHRIVDVANAHITRDLPTPVVKRPPPHRIVDVANAHITRETDGAGIPLPQNPKVRIVGDAERLLFPKGDSGLPGAARAKPPQTAPEPVSADVKLERL